MDRMGNEAKHMPGPIREAIKQLRTMDCKAHAASLERWTANSYNDMMESMKSAISHLDDPCINRRTIAADLVASIAKAKGD